MKKKRYSFSLKALAKFFTRFPIPWWMYAISLVMGLITAELTLKLAEYTISFNKGELYNSVIIGYCLLTVINSIISSAQNLFSNYAGYIITFRARQTIWRKILHLPQSEVDRRQPSSLISGVVNDVGRASEVLTYLFLLVSNVYAFGRAIVALYLYNGKLAAYMLVLVPFLIGLFILSGRIQHEKIKRQYDSLRDMTSFFSEHLSAAKNIKAQAMEDYEEAAGLAAINKRFKADLYNAFMSQIQDGIYSLYGRLNTIIIAVFGSDMIRKGEMESDGINSFSTYMGTVGRYTAVILTDYQGVRAAQGALHYVGEMLDGPQEELDKGIAAPAGEGRDDLVLDHVTFGYEPETPVLHDLSVTIPGGKVTALIGNNGSGKSTLLKLLQGIYTPTSGTIRLGSTDVSEIAPHELRKQFGYILQNNPLFAGTIRDNITYGVKDAEEEAVVAAAKLADAMEFIRALPDGFDTDVGEAGALLSVGQRQRVAIARTHMTNPNYLLMDEAGASLDYGSSEAILRSAREAMEGRTIVVVAHDLNSVMDADNIIVLHHGTLEAAGTHEELLRTSPTYRSYLEKQGYALNVEEAAL